MKCSTNLLQRLDKRIQKQLVTDEKGNPLVHIQALPDITRAVAQTEFVDGFQKVAAIFRSEEATEQSVEKMVTMVVPNAKTSDKTFRSVRLRNKQNADILEKTPHAILQISANQQDIIERMTNLDFQFDVSSLKCFMPERLGGICRGRKETDCSPQQCLICFETLELLACHMV